MSSHVRHIWGLILYTTGIWTFLIALYGLGSLILYTVHPWLLYATYTLITATYFYEGQSWHAFVHWGLWEWFRKAYFAYDLEGDRVGIEMLTLPSRVSNPVIWAVYPHGSYPITPTFFWALNPRFYGNTSVAIHNFVFYVPVMRSLMYWVGGIRTDESAIRNQLQNGKSVCLCPGGVTEIAKSRNTIHKRTGFLRIAYETKTPVIPVWCPDERSYYNQWRPLGNWLERWLGYPYPLVPLGRWWSPLVPKPFARSRIRVGKPLHVEEYSDLGSLCDTFWKEMERLQVK